MNIKKMRVPANTIGMARTRLGMSFSDVRGRVGQEVVSRTRSGLVMKSMPKFRSPHNPNRALGGERMRAATAVWNEMTLDQARAWRRYAADLKRVEPITGEVYSPTAKNAYIGLATKFLQVSPEEAIPVWPPETNFIGDSIILKCEGQPGGVRFTASEPNSADAVTEILFQKLLNVHRSPTKFYKSLLFHRFEAGELELEVPLEPGIYVFGYRFVRPSTGQMTLMEIVGECVVG